MPADGVLLRIGELSKRSGVSPELLRAWERRYGLLRPTRSPGGLRLYAVDDLERVRRMRRHLAEGVAAAEAAALALGERGPAGADTERLPPPGARAAELAAALYRFDEPAAQAVVDELLATTTVDGFLRDVVLPYLHELGVRWERGEASVAQEHFASAVLRGRLLGLGRGWGRGLGPAAVLACLPGEQHELGLIAFGLALRARGWRIAYLGPDTPLPMVDDAAGTVDATLVVLSGVSPERARAVEAQLMELASRRRVALGGGAAGAGDLESAGVLVLHGDPVAAAERVTELVPTGRL